MATFSSLTSAQQTLIENWVDQEFRPATLLLVKALKNAYVGAIPSYIASQSGAASTYASPAADSVAGLLATLGTGEIVPLASGSNQTGLALAQQLTAGEIITYLGGLNTMVTTYYVSAALQAWSNVIGAPNL